MKILAFPLSLFAFVSLAQLKPTLRTNTEARILSLRIPAPRGAIVDRNGKIIARTSIKKDLRIRFGKYDSAEQAVEFFIKSIRLLGPDVEKGWGHTLERNVKFDREEIIAHYKNRRWLPYRMVSFLRDSEVEKIEERLEQITNHPFVLEPLYSRDYPEKEIASHVVGRVGAMTFPKTDRKLPSYSKGREHHLDPFFIEWAGQEGVEKRHEKSLKGIDGVLELVVDGDGAEVQRDIIVKPHEGDRVVLSVDLEWQKIAREALKKKAKRGSVLLMDNRTGELLVSVSLPSFNPELFVPSISVEDYAKLRDDPENPLLARAWQGQYPPGSTFKPFTALTALESGLFDDRDDEGRLISDNYKYTTVRYCPISVRVGNRTFNNWYKDRPEGDLNLAGALSRSCNTYFYPLGAELGVEPIINMAKRFGFGEKTGLDVEETAEAKGSLAKLYKTDKNGKKSKITYYGGDAANISIGQGALSVTPMQLLRAYSALANGGTAPSPKLVKQIQNLKGKVVESFVNDDNQSILNSGVDNYKFYKIIEDGLVQVVNSSRGTGQRAYNKNVVVAGKTGTSQLATEGQYAVWFAGFVTVKNDKGGYDTPYSFVASVEGEPDQKVSGGSFCAPVIGELIDHIYKDIEEATLEPEDYTWASNDNDDHYSAPRPEQEEVEEPEYAEEAPKKKKNFFQRIFGL